MEGLSNSILGCFLAIIDVCGIARMITSDFWRKPPDAMQKSHQKVAILSKEEFGAHLGTSTDVYFLHPASTHDLH